MSPGPARSWPIGGRASGSRSSRSPGIGRRPTRTPRAPERPGRAWRSKALRDDVPSESYANGANIAEGAGRFGNQDNKRFGYFARGSLNETKHWLRRAFKRNLLSGEEIERLKPVIDELSPKLNAYINSLKVSHATNTTNNDQRTTNDTDA